MSGSGGFRFEVVIHRADGRRERVSRHHEPGRAERRLIRLPMSPGESVEILDHGVSVRESRIPGLHHQPAIPF